MTCLITRSIALAALAAGAVWAQPLTIATTSPLPQATIGAAYTQTFSATGGSGTGYTWTATGLPGPWLTMNPGGVLSGTPPLTAVTSTFMVQVTDSASNTASGSFTLPVALSITTASPLPTGTVGVSYSQSVAAAGGSGTYTWSVSAGLLPAGLTLNAASGGISGQPTTAGPASFTIQVTDSNQATATEPFTMTIDPAIVITTSSPLPAGTVGVNYSQTLAATGGSGTYTWAVSVGSLPGGLTLNSTTGLIGGQPTTATTASFTIQATDSNQATASKQFALTINTGIVITTASPLPQGTVGVNYSQTLSATGGSGTYTWAVSVGSLPGGLTLNSTTGLIGGQPTTATTANFTILATDTNQVTGSKQFALTINPAIVITTTSPLPAGAVGANYSQTLAATGGSGTYTWAVSVGSLPGGLTLNSTTGLIDGQPTTAMAASFTIQATDTNQATGSKQFALTINPAIVITTASPLPTGTVGVNYSQTLAATGGSGTYTWAVSVGSLPGGLTLNPATGLLSGQPTTAMAASFTIQATDANQATGSKQFALTVNAAIVITTSSPLPQGTVGVNYSQTLAATGGNGTYTWAVSAGSLPAGLSLNSATGQIGGQSTTATTANFTIQATDTNQATASKQFALTINPAIVITTGSPLPIGTVGVNYSQTVAATGGSGTYTWAVSEGSLPGGLSLNSATGQIGGQPTAATTATFTIQATDTNQATGSKQFSLTINPALNITTTSPLPAGTVGVNYSVTLEATGGSGTYTWAVSVGTLPAGLSLNSATRQIGGQPTTPIVAGFTIQVTDSNQVTASKQFVLTINPPLNITTTSPLASQSVGVAYNQTLSGSGGATPYTWSLTNGSLPGGLSLASSTGTISGTPNTVGVFQFTIQLSDSTIPANTLTKQFAITIAAGLTITTAPTLPNATVGVLYSQTLSAAGGTGPYTWSATGLPTWLALSAAGELQGTPTVAGAPTFKVTVNDSAGSPPASQTFNLTIVAPPVISTTSLPNGFVGVQYVQTLAASGGTMPYTWTIASGSLPGGLSLSSTAGTIAGNPSAAGTSSFTVQLRDATGVTATKALMLTVVAALTISTTSPLPTGEAAIAYSQTLAAAGGTSPYTWSVFAGALPPGLTLAANGSLTGTPGAAGAFSFTVRATDSNGFTASAALALTIAGTLGISTPSGLNGGSVNVVYSQSLAASAGVGPYTWSPTGGALPPGLNLAAAGVISGTPTAAGAFSFTVKVTDALGATASRQFTLFVATGLSIATPSTLPGAAVGVGYSELLQALGGSAPYTWSVTVGSPPAGLFLRSNGNLAGTPTAAGADSFTVQVTDSLGHQASAQFSITVAPALSITTSALPGGTVGAVYSQSLAATGGTPPYTWSLASGSLPGGLTLSAAGAITGAASAAGTFIFTIKVADSAAFIATKQLSITVIGGISVTTAAALPNGSLNTSYSQMLAASGGTPPYTWTLTAGALPTGLALSASGAITGAPTASGTFQFTATVTDSASGTASRQFTLIVGGLAITTTALPGGKVGASYSQTLTITGGTPPYTFTTSAGSLPPGIALKGTALAAVLSGKPTTTGSYTFTIQVADSASATAAQQFTIAITGLVITTSGLPSAGVGTAYSYTVPAEGTAPYTWTIAQGSLPGGLTLDKSSGTISGTPTAAGTSNVTIQVTDSTDAAATAAFTLTVISASFTGLSSTAAAAQQLTFALALGAAYPQEITGEVMLAFQPDASLASPADDPSIQFSTGGLTASFTIPANSTAPVSFSLQTGTVAGSIAFTVSWQAGGATLAVPAELTQTIQIAPAVPAISAVIATTTSTGFQLAITGFSNTREVSQALLQFTPAAGQTLQTTTLTVSLTSAATAWFQSSASDQYGSQFILTLPFTVTDGSASAIGSVSVQLVNTQGTSTSASATL